MSLLDLMNYKNDDDDDFITEGEKPGRGFFDAAILDDAPGKQLAANGSEVYVMHIAFPSRKELLRCIKALSNGQRSYLLPTSTEISFNGLATMRDSMNTFLEFWEEKISGIKMPKRKAKKKIIEDEAQEPPPF